MSMIKKILVPTDFSPCSAPAEDAAEELARKLGAALSVLHVIDDTPYLLNDVGGYIPAQELAYAEETAHATLSKRVEQLKQAGCTASSSVAHGSPAQGIVQAAQQLGAELIVMGTHGRRGFRHLLLGSVAERVARSATVPVLMVPGRSNP